MKCHHVFLIVLGSLSALHPNLSTAQVNPDIQLGSKIPVRPDKPDPVRDGIVRDNFVRCTYGPNKEKIDALLKISDPVTVDYDKAGIDTAKIFRRHKLNNCFVTEGEEVQSSISMTPQAFRYMMLEAAYLSSFNVAPAELASRTPPKRIYVSVGEALSRAYVLGSFADCLIINDPEGADRLLRTPSGTSAEKKAATELVPSISKCLASGQQLTLTPANIRTFVADGLWQRYVAEPFGSN